MTIENICVSLELAKKLKEAGYPQDSLFWWNFYSPGAMDEEFVRVAYGRYRLENIGQDSEESISAPTAAEIGEVLPDQIEENGNFYDQDIQKLSGFKGKTQWGIRYYTDYPSRLENDFFAKTVGCSMSEAFAKMWLILKEKKCL